MPIRAIDPDGKRIFFVGGANNDQDGWNYIQRWRSAFTNAGVKGFRRVNASTGKIGDIAFTAGHRNYSSSYRAPGAMKDYGANHSSIDQAVNQVKRSLSASPLQEDEQLNLAGYSFGSVLQAQVALKLADEGTYIDNLILIGAPISDDSSLFKQLSENENIGNVIRVDIEGDLLSNPQDVFDFLKGA
ncbi:MAG: hypothetical protein AAGA77_26320 [Bacteroidota bacterium]